MPDRRAQDISYRLFVKTRSWHSESINNVCKKALGAFPKGCQKKRNKQTRRSLGTFQFGEEKEAAKTSPAGLLQYLYNMFAVSYPEAGGGGNMIPHSDNSEDQMLYLYGQHSLLLEPLLQRCLEPD